MALAAQIEAAARPRRKPVVADVDHQSDHVLAGVGRTYGQPEGDEQAAAHRYVRRHAADTKDARLLLAALGLITAEEASSERPS